MSRVFNRMVRGDCIKEMRKLNAGIADLVFADPPYNIGYDYDEYHDKKPGDEYVRWSKEWMTEVIRLLKPGGTFWLAIGDEYAAELKVAATRELGLICRSWVVWYYTFGVNCSSKFTRSHAHLLYFVRDGERPTFNDSAVRVPSARQLVYGDKRANPSGRLPDDTWVIRPTPEDSWILRPQDLPQGFSAESDVWYFPRVCGTFKERGGFHGCQMPEQLLARIILACSNKGNLVVDPFAGTGTTLAVAKKLGRQYLGIELSSEYTANARLRLRRAKEGASLAGSSEPAKSAPSTSNGLVLAADGRRVRRADPTARGNAFNAKRARPLPSPAKRRIRGLDSPSRALIEAFERTHRSLSTDRVISDPEINREFIHECQLLSIPGEPADWNSALLRLRKAKCLSHLRPMIPTRISPDELDQCEFASEIAMAILMQKHETTLDSLLCDPELAAELDEIAGGFAPGWSPLHYRWGALRIRKRRKDIVAAGRSYDTPFTRFSFGPGKLLDTWELETTSDAPAVYLLRNEKKKPLYVGATGNLRRRIDIHRRADVYGGGHICIERVESVFLYLPRRWSAIEKWLKETRGSLHGLQSYQIGKLEPRWNLRQLGVMAA